MRNIVQDAGVGEKMILVKHVSFIRRYITAITEYDYLCS